MINLEFYSIVFQEGNTYVAYSPKLDVSSCGGTVNEALNNLKTAVRLFLEEAEKMGTLEDILSESVYEKAGVCGGSLYVHSGDGEICDRKMRHSRWRGYRSLNKISSVERRIT